LHFSDVNVGEYRVPAEKVEFFVAKYEVILRLRLAMEYSDAWGTSSVGRRHCVPAA